MGKSQFTVDAPHRNVLNVRFSVAAGWEQWILLRSDAHHDHPRCNQTLEKKHLEQAKERNALILDAGDTFCAMQGKFDKRADKSAIRPEHQDGDYLDALVRTAADFYRPYAKQWLVFGQGNHETKILKNHETDLIERLVERLKKDNPALQAGGYGGWVKFHFIEKCGRPRPAKTLYYYHGTGGGGPVTRGVIQTNRLAVFTPDADFVLTGHTHDEWTVPIRRQRLSIHGTPFQDEQLHVRTPGYKDAWDDGAGGWEVEKMLGPKPIGAAWLRFWMMNHEIYSEVTRAR